MYNYIIGKVTYAMGNTLVVENNGIGYEIGVSATTLYDCCTPGEIVKIYTYLYVREDTFALYGFSKLEEKTLFLRLIDISGVGPKLAMQILGGMDLNSLTVAIATGDIKTLSKIKGLGKKTAELIVVSMRDQVSADMASAISPLEKYADKDQSEAVFALVSLGMSNTEAVKLVAEIAKTTSGLENIIREALKRLP
ncbi:MAG: Holliday junction branch migration protein RuvA [Clostridia bacterium]|nr:Holliday junction branch migration protein RuvA [Clostridia bacterium]MBR2485816.1 Holliday junction branch migration protein RuvA [Clostridia bacterium]